MDKAELVYASILGILDFYRVSSSLTIHNLIVNLIKDLGLRNKW